MMNEKEVSVWNIPLDLPASEQFLNGKYIKAVILILLEILVNFYAEYNDIFEYSRRR